MLAKRIIPCLDVTGGRVVKGVNFVNLIDAGDPVEAAIEAETDRNITKIAGMTTNGTADVMLRVKIPPPHLIADMFIFPVGY